MKLHPLPAPRKAILEITTQRWAVHCRRADTPVPSRLMHTYFFVSNFHQSQRSGNAVLYWNGEWTSPVIVFSVSLEMYPLKGFVYAMKNLLLAREILIEKRRAPRYNCSRLWRFGTALCDCFSAVYVFHVCNFSWDKKIHDMSRKKIVI